MTKTSTKRAMLGSAISLLLCFAMLVGTTFAWFTDNVTSTGNRIIAGDLEIDLLMYDENDTTTTDKYVSIAGGTGDIFSEAGDGKWEPGKTQIVYLAVQNNGSLALKYNIILDIVDSGLIGSLEYAIVDGATATNADVTAATKWADIKAIAGVQTGDLVAGKIVAAPNGQLDEIALNDVENERDYFALAVHMKEEAGNQYENKDIVIDVLVNATQVEAEIDSFGNQYDADAEYVSVNSTKIPAGSTEATELTAGKVSVTIPAGADAGEYKLEVSNEEIVTNGTETTLSFDINVLKDDEKVSGVSIPVEIEVGSLLNVTSFTHNGNPVTGYTYNRNTGILSFTTDSFSPFAVTYEALDEEKFILEVATADELIEALETATEGQVIKFTDNIKIDPANMSNAYGTTGINVKNGQAIDGNGYTLDVKGAGGTWDSGINTTGGLIRNLTLTGSFRGIFINHNSTHSETVVLENVVLTDVVYTISADQGMYQDFIAKNSTFNGWTSYAATLGNATFENCKFNEGNGYAFCRPYAPTSFVNCEFQAGYAMDLRAAVTFSGCKFGGVAITADNVSTLVVANASNATVK